MDHKLNERIAQTVYQKGGELAEIAPFAASLMSVEGNIAASAYGLAVLGKGIMGQAVGKFDPMFIAGDTSGIMRSTVAGNLDDTGALFYQVGMSITDMVASRAISVGTGLPILSSLMMAGQAGGSTMSQVLKSDGTMDHALALGFVSTALSGITESLEMDRFLAF